MRAFAPNNYSHYKMNPEPSRACSEMFGNINQHKHAGKKNPEQNIANPGYVIHRNMM